MSHLFGWANRLARSPSPDMLNEYLRKHAQSGTSAAEGVSGEGWGASGPHQVARDGLTVVVRGDLIWRTTEPAIVNATNPAEAVLAAYRAHGKGLLEVLHGGFAIAIIEHASGNALLAVDRMGIERLTWSAATAGLVFATSAEVVARFPGATPRVELQSLFSYLYFHMIPSPATAFVGVHKIPPASAIEWRNGVAREFTYWKPTFTPNGTGSFPALKDALHTSLATGVRASRLSATSGAFLSGGLDSSTVAGVYAKSGAKPARTFSMGFGFAEYDELGYARIANRQFGCEGHEYEVTPNDIVELIPKIAAAYDEPFGNASAIPTFCCARFARQHGVDHLLAGDGGDEIFAGNKRYAEQLVFERYQQIPGPLRSLLLEPVLGSLPSALQVSVLRKGRNYIAQAKTPLPDRFENWNFLFRLGLDTILHPDFLAHIDREGTLKHMREVYGSAPPAAIVDKMLYYDWRFTLADNDLRKVGTMCELAGVRVSYPMLHPDVIDVSTQVPADMKMRGTELRSFYKDAMRDFLPAEIINKSKHGFGLPFGLWLQRHRPLAELVDTNLAALSARNLVRRDFLDKLRTLHDQQDASYYGVLISTLSMLEQWFREHDLAP
jgi:asparagine synthase (glutamine-hydrolysing)